MAGAEGFEPPTYWFGIRFLAKPCIFLKQKEHLNDQLLSIPELRDMPRGTTVKQMKLVIREAINKGIIQEPNI